MIFYILLLVIFYIKGIDNFNLTILHTNDVHCHYDEYKGYNTKCDSDGKCFGGIARRATLTKQLRSQYDNSILLDGGDVLTRTVWYLAWSGVASAAFINALKYDVIVPGNHEFDDGFDVTYKYFDSIDKSIKIVASNIDAPGIYDYLFHKKVELKVQNETIGVCGYTVVYTSRLSNPGKNVTFYDEVESVRKCAKELHNKGINKIIALGHAGIKVDTRIAKEVEHVDVVVGGHTNTFMYNGIPPTTEKVYGPYPLVFKVNKTNRLLVQANAYGKYLGKLHVKFDKSGNVESWNGNPNLIDENIERDEEMLQLKKRYENKTRNLAQLKVGELLVFPLLFKECRNKQCMLGNLISDAIASFLYSAMGKRIVVLWPASSMLAPFNERVLTEETIYMSMPYQDTIYITQVRGRILLEALQISARDIGGYNFLVSSGVKYTLKTRSTSNQVENVKVLNSENNFEDLNLDQYYEVAVAEYMYRLTYKLFSENSRKTVQNPTKEIEAIRWYFKNQTMIRPALDDRLIIVDETSGASLMRSLSLQYTLLIIFIVTQLIVLY